MASVFYPWMGTPMRHIHPLECEIIRLIIHTPMLQWAGQTCLQIVTRIMAGDFWVIPGDLEALTGQEDRHECFSGEPVPPEVGAEDSLFRNNLKPGKER
jgi:hypothetical protein